MTRIDDSIGVHPELLASDLASRERHAERIRLLNFYISEPGVTEHRNATIPASVKLAGAGKRTEAHPEIARDHLGGVYDSAGNIVPHSSVKRGTGEGLTCIVGPDARQDVTPTFHVPGTSVYGGYVFRHFGHVLLETMARLWGGRLSTGSPLIYMQAQKAKLPPLAQQLFELAGITSTVRIVDQNTSFDSVLAPEPAFVIRSHAHRAFKDLFLRMTDKALGRQLGYISEQPVYLSRTGLRDDQRRIVGEAEFEEVLLRAGVRIAHTEQMPLVEQIRLVNTHRTIIAPVGSALHLLLFSRISQDVFTYLDSEPNESYILCDLLNNTRARYLQTTSRDPLLAHPVLKRWEYPELLDVHRTVELLQSEGVIGKVPERYQPETTSPSAEYQRLFLTKALADAVKWNNRELANTAVERVATDFPNDKVLQEIVVAVRRQFESAP